MALPHRIHNQFLLRTLVLLSVFLTGLFGLATAGFAQDCTQFECSVDTQEEKDYIKCISDKRSCLESKISETQTQRVTLTNTISLTNNRINLQQLQIQQTRAEILQLEREIDELSERINGLNLSLDRLSDMLVERVKAHYKESRVSPLTAFASSGSFSEVITREQYLNLAGRQTALAMQRAELQRLLYDQQKELKELKQTEVELKRQELQAEQNQLTSQRREQEFLLQETRNNEQRFQQELQRTMAEIAAIQTILAGQGSEKEVGSVETGEQIASIIVGASTCSTGSHLHFEVAQGGVRRDPAQFLKPISLVWSNSPDGEFGFGGDWDWPLNDAARITQGYGMTYYARVRRAYGGQPHTGIDMTSKSATYGVKAVQSGTLYRGSVRCGGGQLRYVKVEHKDSDVSTYYLHVNYI